MCYPHRGASRGRSLLFLARPPYLSFLSCCSRTWAAVLDIVPRQTLQRLSTPCLRLREGDLSQEPQAGFLIVSLSRLGSVPRLDWLRLVRNDPWCSSGLGSLPQASPVGEGRIPKQYWALLGRGRWKMGFLWSQSCPLHTGFHIFCV